MTVCRFCGEEVPHKEYFKHLHEVHPDEMQQLRQKGGQMKHQKTKHPEPHQEPPVEKPKREQVKEEEQQIKGRFITKVIDLPGDILVLYWLAKAAFPDYDATPGEWIADCVRQFYAEHSEELGLDKLFDGTYEAVPIGVAVGNKG